MRFATWGISCEKALAEMAIEFLLRLDRPPALEFDVIAVEKRPYLTIVFGNDEDDVDVFSLPEGVNPAQYANDLIRDVVGRVAPERLASFQPLEYA
jgi:hypothetical protein